MRKKGEGNVEKGKLSNRARLRIFNKKEVKYISAFSSKSKFSCQPRLAF